MYNKNDKRVYLYRIYKKLIKFMCFNNLKVFMINSRHNRLCYIYHKYKIKNEYSKKKKFTNNKILAFCYNQKKRKLLYNEYIKLLQIKNI